ncbi:hypothetical protein L873DRAFT_1785979 [Choiromyces venosus 120613-1]|uniref:Uncharacterized protein n=1 Tax=Choiromyces venosus 120613-1 TaxID=1336337 RepID=A0A3N4K6D5_9PEZI|nr:hypothetical protein L873DRAFT_1785979 [Choiromyces venosus 120613-1]
MYCTRVQGASSLLPAPTTLQSIAITITSPSNRPPHPVCPLAGGFGAMVNELDPHYLVALMNYEFRSGQDGSARCLDPPSHLTSGIVDHHGTNVCTLPILDALAHISVSQPNSQVVAIALQLKPSTKEIRLMIMENQDVADSLVNHLYNIWRKLQALSDEYAGQRKAEWDKDQMLSPVIPPDVAEPLKIEIFREVYKFSLKKQLKRMKKWLRALCDFMEELEKRRVGIALEGFERNLSKAVVTLVLALKLVFKHSENQLTDDEWEQVYWYSLKANMEAKLVLADRHELGCDVLAQELNGDGDGDPFQLRRALEKLISLPCHIESLFGSAHSPHLRFALQYHMTICAVLGQAQIVILPTSQEQWKSLLEAAYGQPGQWQKKDALKLFQKFRSRERKCPVHCECRLIQYLQTKHCDSWDNVPAFSYIGVSKLSCSACRVWIEAFNMLGGPKFYTRGSHGKWYWPWAMPTMGVGSLRENMVGMVLDEYLMQLEKKRGIKRAGSDSSGAIPSGAEHTISYANSQSTEVMADAAVQESGGALSGFFSDNVPRFVG